LLCWELPTHEKAWYGIFLTFMTYLRTKINSLLPTAMLMFSIPQNNYLIKRCTSIYFKYIFTTQHSRF